LYLGQKSATRIQLYPGWSEAELRDVDELTSSVVGGARWFATDVNGLEHALATHIAREWDTAGRPSSPLDREVGYNTDLGYFEWWDGASWQQLGAVAGSSHTHVYDEVPAGTIDGVNDTFTLAAVPTAGTVRLYRNG